MASCTRRFRRSAPSHSARRPADNAIIFPKQGCLGLPALRGKGLGLPRRPLAAGGLTGPGGVRMKLPKSQTEEIVRKVRNSLKSLRGRHRDNRIVRRKGRVYVINKTQRRFKARQG